jgi:hypothetical protein
VAMPNDSSAGANVSIEGASPEQRDLLLEILAGLRSAAIARIELRPHEPEPPEEGLDPPAHPRRGEDIVVDVEPYSIRASWEVDLLATTYRRRAREVKLGRVVWGELRWSGRTYSGTSLEGREARRPLKPQETEALQAAISTAAADELERMQVLKPDAHAVAVTLRVAEPHAFMRLRLQDFLRAAHDWNQRLAGFYLEVRDDQPGAVYMQGWVGSGGIASTRPDLECCAPPTLGMAIDAPPPPRCPVFD